METDKLFLENIECVSLLNKHKLKKDSTEDGYTITLRDDEFGMLQIHTEQEGVFDWFDPGLDYNVLITRPQAKLKPGRGGRK